MKLPEYVSDSVNFALSQIPEMRKLAERLLNEKLTKLDRVSVETLSELIDRSEDTLTKVALGQPLDSKDIETIVALQFLRGKAQDKVENPLGMIDSTGDVH